MPVSKESDLPSRGDDHVEFDAHVVLAALLALEVEAVGPQFVEMG